MGGEGQGHGHGQGHIRRGLRTLCGLAVGGGSHSWDFLCINICSRRRKGRFLN